MRIFRLLLLPFSFLYYLITSFRNHLYNIGYLRSFQFQPVVISVGNLSTGGTGKTPMIEYLIRRLPSQYKITTLSRGYGRKTRGFILAGDGAKSHIIGDEPMQFYLKFHDKVAVSVGEERAWAIPEILFHRPATDIILLDDAFQHRAVVPDFSILLSDYNSPFYDDFILPAGNLRESKIGAGRADVLVITKCPNSISTEEMNDIENRCRKYLKKDTPIYFSSIQYLEPEKVFKVSNADFYPKIILFSGIGKASYLEQFAKKKYEILKKFSFPDHHSYSPEDIRKIKKEYEAYPDKKVSILTTEKDMVKLIEMEIEEEIKTLPLFYIPIEMKIISRPHDFDNLLLNSIVAKIKSK